MKAKKALSRVSIVLSLLLAVACQEKHDLSEAVAMNEVGLPADYMYTLTIPEIMEIEISDPDLD